jgi:SpoVK/Ycf46/Vps4 family AAA+-type ATPase
LQVLSESTVDGAFSAWIERTFMARSDLLVSLVRAGANGDREMLKSAAEALMADERAKKHHVLADRLKRALAAVSVTAPALTASATIGGAGREAIMELEPRLRLDDLILPLPVRENGRQLVEEHLRADVLRAHGYEPRHRVLLSGPPGNGKTSFAEAIAEALSLPFFVVRYDALIGSYLGETNARLRRLFDYVRTQPSVLFFDEFDAIGKERGDTHETGEIKRVVSFLLMQLDQLPSYVVVVAATNHAELLDRAVWRRFQMRLAFPAPGKTQIEAFLDRIISQWPERPRLSIRKISSKLGLVSYAEALDFCQAVRRRNILALGGSSIDDGLATELDLWSSRVRPEALDADRSYQAPSKVGSPGATRSRQGKKPLSAASGSLSPRSASRKILSQI